MAIAKDLVQLGLEPQVAQRLGFVIGSAASAGSTASDATTLGKDATLVSVTSTGASEGLKLPSDAELGQPYVLVNTSANALLVYPPTSGQINGDTASSGTSPLAARGTSIYIRTSVTAWAGICGAAG